MFNMMCLLLKYPASITYLCHKYFITGFSQYYIFDINQYMGYQIFLTPQYQHQPEKSHFSRALLSVHLCLNGRFYIDFEVAVFSLLYITL